MTGKWGEAAYVVLMLAGVLWISSLVLAAARAAADTVGRWWVGKGEERAALDRIADALERMEIELASRR